MLSVLTCPGTLAGRSEPRLCQRGERERERERAIWRENILSRFRSWRPAGWQIEKTQHRENNHTEINRDNSGEGWSLCVILTTRASPVCVTATKQSSGKARNIEFLNSLLLRLRQLYFYKTIKLSQSLPVEQR